MMSVADKGFRRAQLLGASLFVAALLGAALWVGCHRDVCDEASDREIERCERCNCGIDLYKVEDAKCEGDVALMLECLLPCFELPCDVNQYNECYDQCGYSVYGQ